MTALIRSEMRKAVGGRANWGIMVAFAAVVFLGVVQTIGADAEQGKLIWERQFFYLANFNLQIFLLVLGIKIVTDDFRYGTIVPTVLVTPRRSRVAIAKVATVASAGLIAMVMAAGVMLATALPKIGAEGRDPLSTAELRSVSGFVAAGVLWAVVGAGIGLIVRHQLGAIIGAIVWVLAIEGAIGGRFNDLASYLPGGAAGGLVSAPSVRLMLGAATILVAYAAAIGMGGVLAMTRRDVV